MAVSLRYEVRSSHASASVVVVRIGGRYD